MSIFDSPVERRSTQSLKWSGLPDETVIPLCLADMDFLSPASVTAALTARAAHGIFGYTGYPDTFFATIAAWVERRYHWPIQENWIAMNQGVVTSLGVAIRALTREHDRIIIQSPVYHPFFAVIRQQQREVVENRLVLEDGRYRMDFEALAQQAKDAKLLLLCNPHNPVGRVWTPDELTQLGRICLEQGVRVLSDDIHSDFALRQPYHPFASLHEDFARISVTCLSPSKTFNLAGLETSYEVIPDRALSELMQAERVRSGIFRPNLFGITALEQAYRDGDAWLDALQAYLRESVRIIEDHLRNQDHLGWIAPEGTFLLWLDGRKLGMTSEALTEYLLQTARVRVFSGRIFGTTGEGFLRLNYAVNHATLRASLDRITTALAALTA